MRIGTIRPAPERLLLVALVLGHCAALALGIGYLAAILGSLS